MNIRQLNALIRLKRSIEAAEQQAAARSKREFEEYKRNNKKWYASQTAAMEKEYNEAVAEMHREHASAVQQMHVEHKQAVAEMHREFENEWGWTNNLFSAIKEFHGLK